MYIFLHTIPKIALKNILGMSRLILTSCLFHVPNVNQQIGEDESACVYKPKEQGIMLLKPDHNSGYLLTPNCQCRSAILYDRDISTAPLVDYSKSTAWLGDHRSTHTLSDLDWSPAPLSALDRSPATLSDPNRPPAPLLLDCSRSTHLAEHKQYDCHIAQYIHILHPLMYVIVNTCIFWQLVN